MQEDGWMRIQAGRGNTDGGLLPYLAYLWMDAAVALSGAVVEDSHWQCMR